MLLKIAAFNAVTVAFSILFSLVAAESSRFSSRPRLRPTTVGITAQQRGGQKTCDEFYFYDHGTELCEHCRDICDAATVRGTVEQCWENCKPYALRLWPPKPDNPVPTQDVDNGKSSGSPSLPLVAQIVIPLLAIALIGGAGLGLVILRRRKNQSNNRRPPATLEDIELTAVNLLNDRDENGSQAVAESMAATQGSEEGRSSTGVQEEGGSQAEGGGRSLTQATPSLPGDQAASVKFSIPVSPEGATASFAMALPGSPKFPHARPAPQTPQTRGEVSRSESESSLDSTELKTVLPSFSSSSLMSDQGASGGMTMSDV